jgi:U3 small nucleolar RNA-associated protein 14
MNARGVDLDVDQRREPNAQLERSEQLRRKIQGLNEDDEAPEDFVGSDPENDVDVAFDELAGLDGTDQQVPQTAKTKSGLLEMGFVRDAEERGCRVADSMADDSGKSWSV